MGVEGEVKRGGYGGVEGGGYGGVKREPLAYSR